MSTPINIGSRGSPLALVQVKEILTLLPKPINHNLKIYSTAGDIDKTSSLTGSVGDDFFTNTLDQALIKGDIDIAIHSAKDLPKKLDPKLAIIALTKTLDDTDALVGQSRLDALPAGAKIGTSSVLRQQQILKLRPDITIVDIRGTIEERIALVNDGKIDGAIIATCALKRLKLEHLIKDIFPWEGMALQGQLAVVAKSNRHDLAHLFSNIDIRRQYGKVILAGAGPGDPDLITVKAIKALKKADIVFYDYLADDRLLHYASGSQHHYVGKRKGEHSMPQDELNRLLKNAAINGQQVVRLKGGDPLIFGRGAEEITYLQSYHIPVSVIPGISSATGIAADLGVPLTARDISSSVAFISAHEKCEDDKNPSPIHIPKVDTLVFLMGLTKLPAIVQALINSGKPNDYPIMIISKGTRPDEKIIVGTLSNIIDLTQQHHIQPPALIIAGEVTNFYQQVPNKTILYLGTNPLNYRKMGRIIHWPMLNISPIKFSTEQKSDIHQRLQQSHMIIFTSRFAVVNFLNNFTLEHPQTIAAIGSHTTDALMEFGIVPTIISKEETAKDLLKHILKHENIKGKTIFFPRSNLPNPFLKEALIKEGAHVDELTIYVNTKPETRPLPDIHIDSIIFTSPSTVKHFLQDYGKIPDSWEILAKGPVTQEALIKAGYNAKNL